MNLSILDDIGFHPVIRDWFKKTFTMISPPQAMGWPSIRAGKHSLILAPTGSGKTLAAFLLCIDELFKSALSDPDFEQNPHGIHTLYISPLKALNNDIERNLLGPLSDIKRRALKEGLTSGEIRILVRTGDTPPRLRQAMLRRPPHILITTPESLFLILNSEKGRALFRHLRYLIIDEIHALTPNKRGVHLSLSLERLMPLCGQEPVRIGLSATQKPLERIAAYLGGKRWDGQKLSERPVSIIDCGQRKKMDLKIISPIPDFSELPESSVWPAVLIKLYELIAAHKTTLIFANMRSQVERLARQLNEKHRKKTGDENALLILPHHGSMSREMRYDVEHKLKKALIPAVIATSSLELGIDIGSIDCVVHLEAPKSVSGGLQRVGRSGHLLSATSKGRIIPLYLADLDDALALTESMIKADIEDVFIPHNCLDVLAQQIVAEIAVHSWSRLELYNQLRQSYCYHELSLEAFDHVLEMLTGRYSDTKLPALQAVINRDPVNDQIHSLPGSLLRANMNGGTIPDRGYFGVYLVDENTRLGEMEEEFVFESKIGDVFYLGNSEWRIEAIVQDRILVTPASVVSPRPPFWKGELGYQDHTTALKVGAFRQTVADAVERGSTAGQLAQSFHADEAIISSLIKYLKKQKASTSRIPTDRQLVAEFFYDSSDELHLVMHAPLGGRVNALWAIAFAALLEKETKSQVQYSFDDDGFVLRLRNLTEPPPLEPLLNKTADEIKNILTANLMSAPVFSIQFRYNAARALLLTRSRPGRRIPLWLQRLRASDLLQIVKKYPDFPVLLETYRACFEDIFDLSGLLAVITKLNQGSIEVHTVHTSRPSPMVSGLIFDFVSNQMYEGDRTRTPGQIAELSSELLADILSRESIPAIVSRELVEECRARWQSIHADNQAATIEALYLIIKKLGPIGVAALQKRSRQPVAGWLEKLQADGRICRVSSPFEGLVSTENKELFLDPRSDLIIDRHLRYFFENEGPVSAVRIADILKLDEKELLPRLESLRKSDELVYGRLIKDDETTYWCGRQNFAELYRRAIGRRRRQITAVKRPVYLRFLLRWHRMTGEIPSYTDLISQYSGWSFTPAFLENEFWPSRCLRSDHAFPQNLGQPVADLVRQGEVVLLPESTAGGENNCLHFIKRGTGNFYLWADSVTSRTENESENREPVLHFLKQNGSSPFDDIRLATDMKDDELLQVLMSLMDQGLVTTDNYTVFTRLIEKPAQMRAGPVGQKRSRQQVRAKVQQRLQLKDGNWFLTSSFAVLGRRKGIEERLEQQARLLLARHGILVKEWYRRESAVFAPWFQLFQILKRLEWQGEIQRGYFIEGLSGIQYALPSALNMLQSLSESPPEEKVNLVSTTDPALPFGLHTRWDLKDKNGKEISITRQVANHLIFYEELPVMYSENYGSKLRMLTSFSREKLFPVVDALKIWLRLPAHSRPVNKILISQIDNAPALDSGLAADFIENGFERDGRKLILWPSGV